MTYRPAAHGRNPQWPVAGARSSYTDLKSRSRATSTWMRSPLCLTTGRPAEGEPLWFVVDELDSLGAIDGLKDALARLRKFGGRCVLGFQSVAQVSSTYGNGDAQTIIENCGNTLILRCSSSEHGGTSQFASRLIGEREVIRRSTSRGRDRDSLFAVRG